MKIPDNITTGFLQVVAAIHRAENTAVEFAAVEYKTYFSTKKISSEALCS